MSVETISNYAQRGPDVYLLGGHDAEMYQLGKKARRAGAEVIDRSLSQRQASNEGIKLYKDDINKILLAGKTPVAVELAGAEQVPEVVDIDHHNQKTDQPVSILQAMERLGVEPSIIDKLIAANDAGYIPAMKKLLDEEYVPNLRARYGTGIPSRELDEIVKTRTDNLVSLIRYWDRRQQGVTSQMETEAEEAIAKAEHRPSGVIVVRVKSDNFAPVQDRLFLTGENKNLVVVCSADTEEKEVWFFGPGDVCKDTADHFRPRKDERKRIDPADTSNEYHVVANGAGLGKKNENALCLVVARQPEEIISFIEHLEADRLTEQSPPA